MVRYRPDPCVTVSILTHLVGWVQPSTCGQEPKTPKTRFNPHPPGRVGATTSVETFAGVKSEVSILTHLVGWVQRRPGRGVLIEGTHVSILTHLVGWVQQPWRPGQVPPRIVVSILTHLVGWVQPVSTDAGDTPLWMFQSSPTWSGGCNWVLGTSLLGTETGFNPHPPGRVGATRTRRATFAQPYKAFQSSPTWSGGCNP